jgi:hypothetical protein
MAGNVLSVFPFLPLGLTVRNRSNLNFLLGELKDVQQTLKTCIIVAIGLVTSLYLTSVVGYYSVLSSDAVKNSTAIAVVSSAAKHPAFLLQRPL